MGEFEIHQPEKSSNRTIRMPDELIERMGKIGKVNENDEQDKIIY